MQTGLIWFRTVFSTGLLRQRQLAVGVPKRRWVSRVDKQPLASQEEQRSMELHMMQRAAVISKHASGIRPDGLIRNDKENWNHDWWN